MSSVGSISISSSDKDCSGNAPNKKNSLIEWKNLTDEREKDLIERETSNETAKAQLKVQEQVFLESLQMQKEIMRQKTIEEIIIGIGSFLLGFTGGVIFE